MRGSPFGFTNFSRGINVLDSPYTLNDGEARDCLNMVSSPRGAIKKRYGSSIFASSQVASFPSLGVTDKLDRAEDPLSNAGKWSQNPVGGIANKGADTAAGWHTKPLTTFPTISVMDSFSRANENPILKDGRGNESAWAKLKAATAGRILSNRYTQSATELSFAYYTVMQQPNPAVSIEKRAITPGSGDIGHIYSCIDPTLSNYYDVEFVMTNEGAREHIFRIWRKTPAENALLANKTAVVVQDDDRVGFTVRAGKLVVWRYNKAITTWEVVLSTTDASFTTGYTGVGGLLELWSNFSVGETPAYGSAAYWNVTKQVNPAVQVEVAAVPTSVQENFDLGIVANAGTGQGYYAAIYHRASTIDVSLSTEVLPLTSATVSRKMEVGELWGLSLRNERLVLWYKPVGGVWTQACEAGTNTYTEGFPGISANLNDSDPFRLKNFGFGEASAATLPEAPVLSLAQVTIGTTPYLIVQAAKKLFSINASGEVSDITDGLAVTEGLRWSVVQSTAGTPNRVIADGPVYLSNGVDPPRYWSGATKGTAVAEWTAKPEGAFGAVPKAKYLVYLGNRIWAAGNTVAGFGSSVKFSGFAVKAGEGEQADPTNWPTENIVQFEQEDGQSITGLGIAGSYLMVFKKHKTWAIYDLNEGENRRLSDSVGCISHRSIVETPQGTFFLTADQGVYVTNGTSVREVSRNVRPILQGVDPTSSRAAKLDQLENAAAGYLNGHYYLSYMAQDGSMKTLDYDTQLQSWWVHDLAGNQWVAWEPATGASALYTIPNSVKGGVVKAFATGVYTDSGANYVGGHGLSCYWLSSWEPFFQYVLRHRINQPQTKKRVRELFVDGKGQLVTLVARKFGSTLETLQGTVDNVDMAAPTSPLTLGAGELETQAARYYSLGVSRVWSFGFGNASAEPLEIDTYAVDLSFRKS